MEKSNLVLLATVMLFGFLSVFLYQTLVDIDFVKVDFRIDEPGSEEAKAILLFSGWAEKKEVDNIAWTQGQRSAFAIYLPFKCSYQLELSLYFEEKKELGILFNGQPMATLRPHRIGEWINFNFVVPAKLIRKGYNKIVFEHSDRDGSQEIGLGSIRVRNYLKLASIYPQAYLVFSKHSIRDGLDVNWFWCFLGGIFLPLLWIVSATWFFSVKSVSFSRALKIDFFTYLPSFLLILFVYLGCKTNLYNIIFVGEGFLLIIVSLVVISKIYQFTMSTTKEDIVMLPPSLKQAINIAEIINPVFIIGFMILMLIHMLLIKKMVVAQILARSSYLLLAIGLVLKFVGLLKRKID